jgi:hypothetical protein
MWSAIAPSGVMTINMQSVMMLSFVMLSDNMLTAIKSAE